MVARPDTLENGLTVFLQRVTRDGFLFVGFEPIEPVGRLAAKEQRGRFWPPCGRCTSTCEVFIMRDLRC